MKGLYVGDGEPVVDVDSARHSDLVAEMSGQDELAVDIDPPVPPNLGTGLEPDLRDKLHSVLLRAGGQLGNVYRAIVDHPDLGSTNLLPYTDCANAGAVGNRRVIALAIMDGITPDGATVARQAASSVRVLLRRADDLQVRDHLAAVTARLEEKARDAGAVDEEDKQLAVDSAVLVEALTDAAGVYVFTYPHYWRYPYLPDTERRMLKIGRTSNRAWARVLGQAKQTGMPEDPLLLRVYKTNDPVATEKTFHMLLDAAEHNRSAGKAVGVEWFVTTLEYCDAVATALKLEVLKGHTE